MTTMNYHHQIMRTKARTLSRWWPLSSSVLTICFLLLTCCSHVAQCDSSGHSEDFMPPITHNRNRTRLDGEMPPLATVASPETVSSSSASSCSYNASLPPPMHRVRMDFSTRLVQNGESGSWNYFKIPLSFITWPSVHSETNSVQWQQWCIG